MLYIRAQALAERYRCSSLKCLVHTDAQQRSSIPGNDLRPTCLQMCVIQAAYPHKALELV